MFIYIINERGSKSPCKIGISGNPDYRLGNLQCGNSRTLEITYRKQCVFDEPDWGSSTPHDRNRLKGRSLETKIHHSIIYNGFKRLKGEWFAIELRDAIEFIEAVITQSAEAVCQTA